MNVKWLGFIVAVWVMLILLAATFDGQTDDASTWGPNKETHLEYLTDVKKITYAEDETGTFAWLTPNPTYFDAFFSMLSWEFSFLKCPDSNPGCGYSYFRYIVLTPFSLAALFGLLYMFITLLQGFIPRSG